MKSFLQKLILSRLHYARFLNTLSLLEYMGARKIMKSQRQEQIDEKMLAHMSEEIRHAEVLKRAALKLAPELCTTYADVTLLCANEARYYFQTIDHAAGDQFAEQDPWHCYLYTTFLIETRALNFYACFDEVLQESDQPLIFRGILAEEHRHLDEILTHLIHLPDHATKIEKLKTLEEIEFNRWLQALKKGIE